MRSSVWQFGVLVHLAGCARAVTPLDLAEAGADVPRSDAGSAESGPESGVVRDADALGPPDAQADPNVPRLVFPRTATTVTQRQPTLSFVPVPGSGGTQVEYCTDRACNRSVLIETDQDRVTVPGPLTPGVYYWRARRASVAGHDPFSPTWQFYVPDVDADAPHAVDTVVPGERVDLDGDGYDDMVEPVYLTADALLRENLSQHAYTVGVYYGSPQGPSASTLSILGGQDPHAEIFIVATTDVDGDGFVDVVLARSPDSGNAAAPEFRELLLLRGGANRDLALEPIRMATACDHTPAARVLDDPRGIFASTVFGDVNGDGYVDAILPRRGDGSACDALVYLGSAAGFAPQPGQGGTSNVTRGIYLQTIVNAGDVNGDRFDDVVLRTSEVGMPVAEVYYGGAAGLRSTSDTAIACGGCTYPTRAFEVGSAEANGDGYADILVFQSDTGLPAQTDVYPGGSRGLIVSAPTASLPLTNGYLFSLGYLDADATIDMMTLQWDGGFAGYEITYGFASASPRTTTALTDQREYVAAMRGAPDTTALHTVGDLDGDGLQDLGFTSGYLDRLDALLQIYRGTPSGPSEHPAWVLPALLKGDGN